MIRRLSYPLDRPLYAQAWFWMQEQKELYEANTGFYSFHDFCNPGYEVLDFAIEEDGAFLAFVSLILRAKGSCQAALIAPPHPRIRSILTNLKHLEREYFTRLGFWYLFIALADGAQFERARKLARLAGWREVNLNFYEKTLLDHLRVTYEPQTDAATSSNAV